MIVKTSAQMELKSRRDGMILETQWMPESNPEGMT